MVSYDISILVISQLFQVRLWLCTKCLVKLNWNCHNIIVTPPTRTTIFEPLLDFLGKWNLTWRFNSLQVQFWLCEKQSWPLVYSIHYFISQSPTSLHYDKYTLYFCFWSGFPSPFSALKFWIVQLTLNCSTLLPTIVTTPATSWPGTQG